MHKGVHWWGRQDPHGARIFFLKKSFKLGSTLQGSSL